MAIQSLQRTFKYGDKVLPDPNPDFSEKEVKEFYANQYPELVSSTIAKGEEKDGKIQFTFKTKFGTKG